MRKKLLKARMDYLFMRLYGTTLEEMDLDKHEQIIIGIDSLENFYDDSYTYFILPSPYAFWEYYLYRVIGSGKHGFTIENLGYIEPDRIYSKAGLIDKDGKSHWKQYKEEHWMFKIMVNHLKNKYGFDGLYHFTDFSNLKSIFKSGYLMSRNECEQTNIQFTDSASRKIVNFTSMDIKECVRFYYRPKTPTLYVNEGIKLKKYMDNNPHLPIPVYLVFDEELIYLDTTMFTDRNARCYGFTMGDDFNFFSNIDWHKVFSNNYHKEEWKNKMQAELLSKIPVSLDYLNKIIFRCEADLKRAINQFGKDERFIVDPRFFSDKNNHNPYKEWHYNNFIKNYQITNLREDLGLNMLLLDLQFQKPWRGYKVDILIKNHIGEVIQTITFDSKAFYKIDDVYSIRFIIDDFSEEFHSLEIYLNDILSIEENLKGYR